MLINNEDRVIIKTEEEIRKKEAIQSLAKMINQYAIKQAKQKSSQIEK